MTYRCGMGPVLPAVVCDALECPSRVVFDTQRAPPWFSRGEAAPGWLIARDGKGRRDYCPAHKHVAVERGDCLPVPDEERVCERGTDGCVVRHKKILTR